MDVHIWMYACTNGRQYIGWILKLGCKCTMDGERYTTEATERSTMGRQYELYIRTYK